MPTLTTHSLARILPFVAFVVTASGCSSGALIGHESASDAGSSGSNSGSASGAASGGASGSVSGSASGAAVLSSSAGDAALSGSSTGSSSTGSTSGVAATGSTNGSSTSGAPSGSSGSGAASGSSSNDAAADANAVDAGSCEILASHYDQSCAKDTDCHEVTSGDYCSPSCFCGGTAINTGALGQFNQDVAQTPSGKGLVSSLACPCAANRVCCRNSLCTTYCL